MSTWERRERRLEGPDPDIGSLLGSCSRTPSLPCCHQLSPSGPACTMSLTPLTPGTKADSSPPSLVLQHFGHLLPVCSISCLVCSLSRLPPPPALSSPDYSPDQCPRPSAISKCKHPLPLRAPASKPPLSRPSLPALGLLHPPGYHWLQFSDCEPDLFQPGELGHSPRGTNKNTVWPLSLRFHNREGSRGCLPGLIHRRR